MPLTSAVQGLPIQGVIFDLGGTLLDFPDWESEVALRWRATYRRLRDNGADALPDEEMFVQALLDAENEHWRRVETEHWSGPPSGLVLDGYRRMGRHPSEEEIITVLDACARALDGWAQPFPDARDTLETIRGRGLRIGLLSNTWWAADWHNADLATHGLHPYLDELVYTSDLPHSKPHPEAFRTIAARLDVPHECCVMIGDRPVDDIQGALGAGMRAVFKTNNRPPPAPIPPNFKPTATIGTLSELPTLLETFNTR
ncbi:MAG: HAD family hydrolase [Dehalococcoidia bacterium]